MLMPGVRAVKRALDIAVSSIAAVFSAPILLALCLLIRLDSPGPIFYGHQRVGRNRKMFKVWKFRSMRTNGDALLKEHFEKHPEALDEWTVNQKLKKDPRITKLGQFLRKSSLDELPQLWNILCGDMSLVGPRPIVEAESLRYGCKFGQYAKVAPGLTGLWQVSGRNHTTYEERVRLDTYYVRNWSLWLDLYLLVRTVKVVLRREGAY
jgi:Undecaprenyl-phosphate galactose phosphotransferase WbaP